MRIKKFIIIALLVIVVVVSGVAVNAPKITKVAQAIGFMPFGGFVVSIFPCTCSFNVWLFMSPFFNPTFVGGGSLVYQPGATIVYMNYVIPVVGVWLLGDYVPGVQGCFFWVPSFPPFCAPLPSTGMIHQVGTSF